MITTNFPKNLPAWLVSGEIMELNRQIMLFKTYLCGYGGN